MSQKNKTAPVTTEKTEEEVVRYDVAVLRKSCYEVLSVTSSTFDGAFYGVDTSKQYSIDEAKSIINTWLKKEVK